MRTYVYSRKCSRKVLAETFTSSIEKCAVVKAVLCKHSTIRDLRLSLKKLKYSYFTASSVIGGSIQNSNLESSRLLHACIWSIHCLRSEGWELLLSILAQLDDEFVVKPQYRYNHERYWRLSSFTIFIWHRHSAVPFCTVRSRNTTGRKKVSLPHFTVHFCDHSAASESVPNIPDGLQCKRVTL